MPTKPRVLVVAPYPPTPPFAGGRRRIRELIAASCDVADVTVASIVFDHKDEVALAAQMGSSCELMFARPSLGDCPSYVPHTFSWCWSSELARQVEERHRRMPFDIAIASHSFAFPFIAPLDRAWKLVDAHNLEYKVHAQFARLPARDRDCLITLAGSGGDGYRESDPASLRTFEQDVWASADTVLCVSEAERAEVLSAPGNPRVLLVPNASVRAVGSMDTARVRSPQISFIGALNYIPNIDAVLALTDEVLPIVRDAIGDAVLIIAGREPSRALVQHCSNAYTTVVPDPDDIFATIAGSVTAVPLRMGAGTRIKVLEARSFGLRVVASTIAVEGLDIDHDPGLLVIDGSEGMAQALVQLLLLPDVLVPPLVLPPSWTEAFTPMLREFEEWI
jgi:glycosyltransferase involved in cell wall biosynthesis